MLTSKVCPSQSDRSALCQEPTHCAQRTQPKSARRSTICRLKITRATGCSSTDLAYHHKHQTGNILWTKNNFVFHYVSLESEVQKISEHAKEQLTDALEREVPSASRDPTVRNREKSRQEIPGSCCMRGNRHLVHSDFVEFLRKLVVAAVLWRMVFRQL